MSQDFPCPKCSEPIRPGMLRCRECGTTLNVERRGLIKEKTPATEPSDDATRNRDAIVNLSVREEAYLVNEQSADQVAYQLYRDGSPASDDEIEIEFAALPESNDPTVDERTDETNPVEGGQKPGRDVTRMLRKPPYSIVAGSALTLSLLTAFYGSFHRRPSDLPSSQGPQQPRQEVAGPEEPVANRNDAMPDKVPARQLDTVENQPTVATGDAPNQVPAHKTIADPVVEPESAPVDRATMLKRAGQAVVVIRVLKSDGETATGSGFLCRDRQTIVANFHVLKDAVSASVEFENGQRTTVFGFESALPGLDLVVLRLNDPAIDVDPLPLAEKLPTQGETVFAFGSPRGLQGTVSTSTVSATRTFEECSRHVEQATGRKLPFEFKPDSQWIQTALTMSSEAGGGPLVTSDGRVAGVTTWTIDAEPALSFALHSTELKMALPAEPRMPQLLASLPNTNVKVESPKNADEWKATEALLTKLEDQRQELLQKKEQLNEDRETLQQRVKAVEADLAVLVPKLKAAEAIARIQQKATYSRSVAEKQFYLQQLVSLQTEYGITPESIGTDRKEASQLQAELSVLAQQFETQGRVDLDLQQKAAVLREEWLRIADPFGRRERGETDRAIELFSRWMAKEPEAFTPVLWRGLTYLLDEDQTTQALADLEAAEKLEAKSALPPAARALALHRRGEISKARQLFRQARIAGRDDPLVLSLEARYQQETGNFNRAVFGFEQALQIDPDNVTALSWLADVLATCPDNEIRNPETAQSHARRACQLSNWSRWDSLLAYASSLASLGIFDNAAIHARKAVILAPAARKPNCQQRLERFQQRQEWQIPQ